jgi:hypothetical protein
VGKWSQILEKVRAVIAKAQPEQQRELSAHEPDRDSDLRSHSALLKHYGDNFIPVIPVDRVDHTQARPFCLLSPSCPCHEDPENIAKVNGHVRAGLLTPQEATRTVKGEIL